MEINTRLSGAPLPPLCTSFLHIYDCYSVCFPDLFPHPSSLYLPSLSAPIRWSELHYTVCALLEISHISHTTTICRRRRQTTNGGELYKLTYKMNDGIGTCALYSVLSIGRVDREGTEGGISHIRMQMNKIWNICLSNLKPAQAGNPWDTHTCRNTETDTHTCTDTDTYTGPIWGVLRVAAIH